MALVGWVLRAMGLHHNRALVTTPWTSSVLHISCSCPSHTEMMKHLDHIAQATTHWHLTLGRWSRACMMMWHHLHHHPSPCKWSTGIFDLFGDPWEHLCAHTCHLEHHKLLQGANPLSTAFFNYILWHIWTPLGLLQGPTTCTMHYSTSWEAYSFGCELVWWACHQKLGY